MADLPQWLSEALSETPLVSSEPALGPLAAGQIRVVKINGSRRHLLVGQLDDRYPVVVAILLTGFTEMATDDDVLLSPEETGLSYSLVAQTSLAGTVLNEDLGEIVGSIPQDKAELLSDATVLEEFPFGVADRGLPVHERTDSRVAFQQEEGLLFDVLQERALAFIHEAEKPIVDPRDLLIRSLGEEGLRDLRELISWGIDDVRMPSAEVLSYLVLKGELSVDVLGTDVFSALLPVIERSRAAGRSWGKARSGEVTFEPAINIGATEQEKKVICEEIAEQVSQGAKVLTFSPSRRSSSVFLRTTALLGRTSVEIELPERARAA